MCRVFGCVAAEPVSIRHELLDAENPLIRQSEEHDSGWGMAVYERPDGAEPRLIRFPEAAYAHDEFNEAADTRGRIYCRGLPNLMRVSSLRAEPCSILQSSRG